MARAKSTTKKSCEGVDLKRKRKKRRSGFTPVKYVKKPGFEAFTIKHTTSDGKKVISTEVVEPETGIHSRAWAQSIAPQESGFFRLPIEIRHTIYGLLLDEAVIKNPRKHGMKFNTPGQPSTTIEIYNLLSQVCRQAYVDVVGGGLLHTFAKFEFTSPDSMSRYLGCINPSHKASIRNINLTVKLTRNANTLPKKMFLTLSSLPNLNSLHMTVAIDFDLCTTTAHPHHFPHWNNGINSLSRNSYYKLRKDVYEKMKRKMNWDLIKNVTELNIKFQPAAHRSLTTPYYGIRRYWARYFDYEDRGLVALVDEIKEIVLKKKSCTV